MSARETGRRESDALRAWIVGCLFRLIYTLQKKRCSACAENLWKKIRSDFQRSDQARTRAYAKKHYDNNRDRITAGKRTAEGRAKKAAIIRNRRKRDPGYRLHCNISRVVALSLNGDKGGRRWESLLGYTREQLVVHLERQFTKGMTWDNMGGEHGWQLDHIIPRASFTFSTADDPEFKACWALTNLRPLWRVDNLTKREKRLHLI
jgi:hypothetical protein